MRVPWKVRKAIEISPVSVGCMILTSIIGNQALGLGDPARAVRPLVPFLLDAVLSWIVVRKAASVQCFSDVCLGKYFEGRITKGKSTVSDHANAAAFTGYVSRDAGLVDMFSQSWALEMW